MLRSVEIVVPCYNPNETWHLELLDFNNEVKNNYQLNFIIVNDGSGANSISEKLKFLADEGISINYISYSKNMGKGFALRQGVLASKGEFVVYTDIDFPFTNKSVKDLLDLLVSSGYSVVSGYRNQDYYQKTMSVYRKLLSKTFRFFIENILKMSVTDTQCGLKGFNSVGKRKFLETSINRYLFDFEFIYTSEKDPTIFLKTLRVQLKDGIVFSQMKPRILFQEIFNLLYILLFKRI